MTACGGRAHEKICPPVVRFIESRNEVLLAEAAWAAGGDDVGEAPPAVEVSPV